MELIKKINKIILGIIIIILFFFLVGLSYAYFTAGIKDSETEKTIIVDSGKMDILFKGGDAIIASNIKPSFASFASKEFTVAGTNNITDAEMEYKITLVIDENTFTFGAISYILTSTNTANNGSTVSPVSNRTGIGISNIEFGNGKFIDEVNGALHTYVLDIYFYEIGDNQSEDMNKTFKAHVGIEALH
ncbi:MAG: hypothetical protein WCR80_04035 [Bacilli bacterium]